MKNMTVFKAAELCGGRLCGENISDMGLGKVVIDSRAVAEGDLFVAYRGENADGHDYIARALENGAACCLAERLPEGVSGPVILVEDVQKALENICSAYRAALSLPVIGITGSVGKTTAKEMISAVLSQRYRVLKTEGNLNNQIGVPMTLSRIEAEHEAAVVEMGISGFGEMSCLARMARPDVAVFTVIGHAHLEFLHDLEGVFKAKTEMLDYMDENGSVIVNGDDPWLRSLSCRQHRLSYGLSEDCDVRAEKVELTADCRVCCDIVYGERRLHARIPAYGEHMVYAALEGAAVGFVMGLTDAEIEQGITKYETVGRRGAVTRTKSLTIVDDSYNGNPDSMRCAIDSLTKLPGRRVCVLADMLEMGEDSGKLHYAVGRYAVEKGVELVLACGAYGGELARGAGGRGRSFESREALIKALPEYMKKNDTVLVKASRGMKLEQVSDALKNMEI